MATNYGDGDNLTGPQYMRLGQVISCSSIETIALGYFDIKIDRIKQLKDSRKDDPQGFVRDVINEWACRHPDNQVQVRTVTNHFLALTGNVF